MNSVLNQKIDSRRLRKLCVDVERQQPESFLLGVDGVVDMIGDE